MTFLRGKVEFKLALNDSSSDFANSRKRKRNLSSTTDKQEHLSGFFFRPNDSSLDVLDPKCSQYLLSVPYALSRYLSEAAAYQLTVGIDHYSVVPLAGFVDPVALIEVKPYGLKLVHEPPPCPPRELWRLCHFRRRELVEEGDMKASKACYSISGIVDAISPITSLDPSNPFCLMELCDEGNKDLTCVVAFFGDKSLVWQQSIHPGEELELHGLRRKRWHVPESFEAEQKYQYLNKRVPTFVFVFSDTSRVVWAHSIGSSSGTFVIPSTPLPLATLQGTISAVKTKSVRKGGTVTQTIEYLDIEYDVESDSILQKPTSRLFLAYFPMSSGLQLSLRNGAIIRAVNIHSLGVSASRGLCTGKNIFGTCLRSTVTLLCPPMDRGHRPVLDLSLQHVVPYRLAKVPASYRDMIFKKHASKWLHDNFDEFTVAVVAPLPTADDLLFLRPSSNGRRKNPYAEFFDHALDIENPSSQNQDACGCFNSREERQNGSVPLLMGLNELRVAAMRVLGRRFLSKVSKDSSVAKGWSGSIHLSAQDIIHEVIGAQAIGDFVVVGGFAGVGTANKHVLLLSDRVCQLSVRFWDPATAQNGDFVTGCVESVVVSCFCLVVQTHEVGLAQNSAIDDSVILQSLPPLNESMFDNTIGGGAILRIGKYALVASVQLWCKGQQIVSQNGRISLGGRLTPMALCSFNVTKSLAEPKSISGRIQGTIIRSRFRLARSFLVATVADFEVEEGRVVPSCLQTLDVEVSVPANPGHMVAFKRMIHGIKSEEMMILEDECILGVSWWTVAEDCHTAPLVAGGWDEYSGKSSDRHLCVTVSLPAERLTIGRRGYIRYSTTVNLLQAELAQVVCSHSTPDQQSTRDFDFIIGDKLYNGTLCRRPRRRRQSHTRCLGELWDDASWLGSADTIAGLFQIACRTIRTGDPCFLSPSLVRRVRGAQFLGVMFCRAICKCNRCFKTLVNTTPGGKIWSDFMEQPTFWHNPAPGAPGAISAFSKTSTESSEPCPPHVKESLLRCPSNCHLKHLSIQWECSGVLDDGTGQAKLYADREAALTLLCFDNEELDQIEKAMWGSSCPEIRYQKSIPPRKELREQVHSALANYGDRGPNPLERLPPAIMAEYLVHQHCRLSAQPRRVLEYFVRCKPLSDGVSHLNHDTVETYVSSGGGKKSGQVASYKLPPIKLELVECCVPSDTTTGTSANY